VSISPTIATREFHPAMIERRRKFKGPENMRHRWSKAGFALALALMVLPLPCAAQGCQTWAEALAKSFFPHQVDEPRLREFANASAKEYFQAISQMEEKSVAEQLAPGGLQRNAAYFDVQTRLNSTLARFYRVGSQLYGLQLNSENLTIAPTEDINAFATGSHVFVNAGLMQYFLRPADYVGAMVNAQTGALTSEQYEEIRSAFPWRDDWNSIYYVLAHEASHNLMRHRDDMVFTPVRTMFADYQQSVLNYRKDVANGHTGGVKRYLWQSMKNFSQEIQNAEQQRNRAIEADTVALLILQRSGLDPEIGISAAEKMDMVLGGGNAGGWQAGMTEVLCSTHPDWMQRIQHMQMTTNCLRSTGKLCENHAPYPVENLLPELHDAMAQLDTYQEETVRIAGGNTSGQANGEAEIKVDPKDATLKIDGQIATPGKMQLPVGPHTVLIEKNGYKQQEQQIIIFPDVQPKVKVKLKKL